MNDAAPRAHWPKLIAGFALIFLFYQAAEGMQTVIAPGNPVGPALMFLAFLLAWPVGSWLGGRGYGRFGLGLTRGWGMTLVGGMLLAAVTKMAALEVGSATGVYSAEDAGVSFVLASVVIAGLTTFVPSVTEDILTRGFLLRATPVRLGFWSYTLLSALLYTANHIWRFDWGVSEQLRLFCLGLAYGAAAWRWRSLWGAVALHWGWNLSSALADQALAMDTMDVVAGRMITGGAHLLLLALVLLFVPAHSEDADERGQTC